MVWCRRDFVPGCKPDSVRIQVQESLVPDEGLALHLQGAIRPDLQSRPWLAACIKATRCSQQLRAEAAPPREDSAVKQGPQNTEAHRRDKMFSKSGGNALDASRVSLLGARP